jgi:hypothetical protein
MSAPHIACQQGRVEQAYDGGDSHPVELCLVTGAVAHIRIDQPPGAQWPLPETAPSTVVRQIDAHRVGGALDVTLSARARGTATLTVGAEWHLTIAVV